MAGEVVYISGGALIRTDKIQDIPKLVLDFGRINYASISSTILNRKADKSTYNA